MLTEHITINKHLAVGLSSLSCVLKGPIVCCYGPLSGKVAAITSRATSLCKYFSGAYSKLLLLYIDTLLFTSYDPKDSISLEGGD